LYHSIGSRFVLSGWNRDSKRITQWSEEKHSKIEQGQWDILVEIARWLSGTWLNNV
jgi:hypothetical protein